MSIDDERTGAFAEHGYLLRTHDGMISGIERKPKQLVADAPLVIAIHGGAYTSRYFDIPGFSLLDRASEQGIRIIALDRPGYGRSTSLAPLESTVIRNAECLDHAIGDIWQHSQLGTRGIVLVGHSIGAAVAVAIASRRPTWPLLGIALSGVGLTSPPEAGETWAALPETPMIHLPTPLKDAAMFGPQWTYSAAMPKASRPADAAVPRAELIDIVTTWPATVRTLAAEINVPVHYRQGEFDKLWLSNEVEVAAFGAVFSASPCVDARLFKCAGHCIDFHRLGAALHLEQLAFALRCAVLVP